MRLLHKCRAGMTWHNLSATSSECGFIKVGVYAG